MLKVMSKTKETIVKRMFELRDHAVRTGRCANTADWCNETGILKQNVKQVTLGKQCFTHDQIAAAVKIAGASYDFVYGKIKTFNYLVSLEK